MYFNLRSLLAGAAALSLFVGVTTADCTNGPWTDVTTTGGQGGGAWCATKYDQGIVITGVEVWASQYAVRALQFYYSDGTDSGMIGQAQAVTEHNRIDWDPTKDGISQMKTWGNGDGHFLGRLYLRLKSGGELSVGKDTDDQNVYETDVQSGVLLGAFGNNGNTIDKFGALFLRSKVNKVTVEDVTFSDNADDLNAKMQGLQTVAIDSAQHTNNQATATDTFSFSRSQARAVTKTYQTTNAFNFGITEAVEVSGELLGIGAKSTTTLNFQYTRTDQSTDSTADAATITYGTSTSVAPGTTVYCRAIAMTGQYTGKYSATVKIWLDDGSQFAFASGGTFNQVAWSDATSDCQNTPYSDNIPLASPPQSQSNVNSRAIKFVA